MSMKLFRCVMALLIALALAPLIAYADQEETEQIRNLGISVNTGLDTGYSESSEIKGDDVHFGWKLGQFSVSGFTRAEDGPDGCPVFLKTAGDKVKLSFTLAQDIDALNGSEALSINEDTDGYDQYFGVQKTSFGRGALIVRQTDYRNVTGEPQVHVDYLKGATLGADTEVQLFEEGDYEVSLDYEIRNDPRKLGPVSVVPEFSNYKISFKFAVRNGNCMVFPLDAGTGSELSNEEYAPNGFILDLAKSRYLDINVKREVMAAGANGLTEDVRFNGPAKDGDRYTEDGVYTITATNQYTDQQTIKKIFVGDNPVLKAHVVTGLPISEINQRIANGETVSEDGTLVAADTLEPAIDEEVEQGQQNPVVLMVIVMVLVCVAAAILLTLWRRRSGSTKPMQALPASEEKNLQAGGRPGELPGAIEGENDK